MSSKKTTLLFPLMPADSYPEPLVRALLGVVQFPEAMESDVAKEMLVRHLCASVALDLGDKHRVLASLPGLSLGQCQLLVRTWRREQDGMAMLFDSHPGEGVGHAARAWLHNSLLATFFGAKWSPATERYAMRCFVTENFAGKKRRIKQLKAAMAATQSATVEHVFGRALREVALIT
ncbi:MAG: hypothetical protein E6Q94_02625 [Burkholderiaceae bacterium]|nr:MAG: hypothetical protein E6Q94_02625 [Burkholderiaceae bacterium]